MREGTAWSSAVPVVRAVVGVLALGLLAWAVVRSWPDVRSSLADVGWWPATGALACAVVATALSALMFRVVMATLHAGRSVRTDVEDFLASQLAKYLPGGFWAVAAQTELSGDAGVPRARSGTASVLTVALSLAAAVVLSPLAGTASARPHVIALAAVAVLLVVGAGLLLPRLAPGRVPRLPGRVLLLAAPLALGVWAAYGAHLWLLVHASGTSRTFTYGAAVGCFALAWAVGLVTLVAPAGIGVRQLLLVGLLTPVLSGGHAAALAVAVLSRFVLSVSDALLGVGALLSRRRRAARGTG